MEIVRLVRAVEELIFEVGFWLLSYPKSLLKVIVHPGWVLRYVTNELVKDERERFDEYMSPALFYALSVAVVIVPRFEAVSRLYESAVSSPLYGLLSGSPEKLVASTAVILAVCPLAFAWVAGASSKLAISRSSLRAPLLCQFLIAGPFILVVSFSLDSGHSQLARLIGLVALIWFCVAEWLFFRHLLSVGKIKAGLLVFAGFGAWYIVNLAWGILLGLSFLFA